MNRSIFVTNPLLKSILPYINPTLSVIGCWDEDFDKKTVYAMATSVWDTIDATFLSTFPNLKSICHLGVGTDNIDKNYLQQHDIELHSQPLAGIHDTAELAVTLMLSLARKIIQNDSYTRLNHWAENKPRFVGNNLLGKQLGLVGMGKIGSTIARFASAFDMKISYTARSNKNNGYLYYDNITQLAQDSDFLILCCSGGADTFQLIDKSILEKLGATGYLVNVSRGSVINEQDLIHALQTGLIAGAGLDVYSQEPNIAEAFKTLNNVILSPHMGSSTKENLEAMFKLQAQQLNESFLEFVAVN